MKKVSKTKPPFLIQKCHQFIFAVLFELLIMSHRYHKKEQDCGAENVSKSKFKCKNCALQISEHQFLGEIFEKGEISI